MLTQYLVKYFLISAPVDWQQDQYIRRFLLPTGEYISCVLWYVLSCNLIPSLLYMQPR